MSIPDLTTCPACGARNRVPGGGRGAPHCARCQVALPWLVEATDASFIDVVETSALPVLLDLWAPWCPPCRMIAPAVEASATRFAGRLKVVKVNVDTSPAVSQRFGVRGIPTVLILRHGHEVARQVGALTGTAFIDWVQSQLTEVHT